MKRLVWLLIAVFGTAFAQVQPVDLPQTKTESCCCCDDQTDACGMPDCAQVPAGCPRGQTLPAATSVRSETARQQTGVRTPARGIHYFVKFESRPALTPAAGASRGDAPATAVPLFKAHCRFQV